MLVPWKALNGTHRRTAQCTQGSGAVDTAISGVGGEGRHRQGFQRLWAPPGDGDLLQIPGVGDLEDGWQLTDCGEEIGPGKEGLE